jgi:hypothetical protein
MSLDSPKDFVKVAFKAHPPISQRAAIMLAVTRPTREQVLNQVHAGEEFAGAAGSRS